jgi:hypothetical protein
MGELSSDSGAQAEVPFVLQVAGPAGASSGTDAGSPDPRHQLTLQQLWRPAVY